MLSLIYLVMADPLEDSLSSLKGPADQQQFATSTVSEIQRLLERAREQERKADARQRACLSEPLASLSRLPELAARSQSTLSSLQASGDQVHADLEVRRLAVTLTKGQEWSLRVDSCMNGGSGVATGDVAMKGPRYPGLPPANFVEHEEYFNLLESPSDCGSCY